MDSASGAPSPPLPSKPFGPYGQNVSFLGPNGVTAITVPIPAIDAFNDETLGKTANAGAQIGAVVLALLAVLALTPSVKLRRPLALLHVLGLVVAYAVSIFWFCATFNAKLALHLVANRGLLPPTRTLSSIEVLVMTNGILMVIPGMAPSLPIRAAAAASCTLALTAAVLFAGLQWATFLNFELSSLTLVSVDIILPLGTLAAQRMTSRPTTSGDGGGGSGSGCFGCCSSSPGDTTGPSFRRAAVTVSDRFKAPGLPAGSGAGSELCTGSDHGRIGDHFDLELRQIDSAAFLASRHHQDEKC